MRDSITQLNGLLTESVERARDRGEKIRTYLVLVHSGGLIATFSQAGTFLKLQSPTWPLASALLCFGFGLILSGLATFFARENHSKRIEFIREKLIEIQDQKDNEKSIVADECLKSVQNYDASVSKNMAFNAFNIQIASFFLIIVAGVFLFAAIVTVNT